jgi:RNA polymerase sigma-70 factor (ECF subfamily)
MNFYPDVLPYSHQLNCDKHLTMFLLALESYHHMTASHTLKPGKRTASDGEQELVRRAQDGDAQAFSEIVRRNEDMVYGFAFKVCRDRNSAEETLQDTFVNVFRKLNQFDGRSKFSTWLYSIVTNNCLMKRRRRMLEASSVQLDEESGSSQPHVAEGRGTHAQVPRWNSTPLDEAMTKELRNLLDTAIQKLPLEYRLVFILRDIEGTSAEETATIMNLSVPAIKSRLRRARVFLREELQEYMIS